MLTGLLRGTLGFNGLVVTDALVMEAITARHGPAEAAVLAFEAGADLILMPADADAAISGISQAIAQRRIPIQRLHQALKRRREAMAKVQPPAPALPIPTPEERQLEQELVAASLEQSGPATIPAVLASAGPGLNR